MDQAQQLRKMASGKSMALGSLEQTSSSVFAVASGKGGVGKTNLVANMAVSLAQLSKKVAVLDADFGLANIDILLGLTPKHTIEHVLRGEKLMSEIIMEGPAGVRIIPASSGIEEMTTLSPEQFLRITTGLKQLSANTDYMIIDTAAGISENVIRFLMSAPNVLLVTNPEPPAIVDAYAVSKVLLKRQPDKKIRLVVNSVNSFQEAEQVYVQINSAVKRFLNREIEFFGYLFYDECLKQCVNNQKSVVIEYPGSRIARSFAGLAANIVNIEQKTGNEIIEFWSNFEKELL